MTKSDTKKPSYEILNLEGHWTSWTWSTWIALRDKGVGGHVNRDYVDANLPSPDGSDPQKWTEWQKAEAKAMKIIDKRISGSVRQLIVNKCNTAIDIWEHLKKRYVLVSQRRVTRLTKALDQMEWDGVSSLANFIARFKERVDDIVRSGGHLEEQTIADKLLAALPTSWGHRVDVWQAGRKSLGIVPNFDDVEDFLLAIVQMMIVLTSAYSRLQFIYDDDVEDFFLTSDEEIFNIIKVRHNTQTFSASLPNVNSVATGSRKSYQQLVSNSLLF